MGVWSRTEWMASAIIIISMADFTFANAVLDSWESFDVCQACATCNKSPEFLRDPYNCTRLYRLGINGNVTDMCQACATCNMSSGYLRDPYNCPRYYRCNVNTGKWAHHQCILPGNAFGGLPNHPGCGKYQCTISTCDVKPCDGLFPQPCYTEMGPSKVVAPGNCHKYFECLNSEWYTKTCSEDMWFLDESGECGPNPQDRDCHRNPCREVKECRAEFVYETGLNTDDGHWNKTARNGVQRIVNGACPKGQVGEVSRRCDKWGLWDEPQIFCADIGYTPIWKKILDLEEKGDPVAGEVMADMAEELHNFTSSDEVISAGNLKICIDIINKMSQISRIPHELIAFSSEVQAIVNTTSILLSEENTVNQTSEWDRLREIYGAYGVILLSSVERYSTLLIAALGHGGSPQMDVISENIVLTAMHWLGKDVVLPGEGRNVDHWSRASTMYITNGTLASFHENVTISVCFFASIHHVLPVSDTNDTLGPRIVTVNINNHSEVVNLPQPMELSFDLLIEKDTYMDGTCVFWHHNETLGGGDWDTTGCTKTASDGKRVVCTCEHMTSFAVLVSSYRPDEHHSRLQSILSTIGCALSVFCLLLTITLYAISWKAVRSGFAVMLINLCVALVLANFVFFIGADQTKDETLCSFVAMTLHVLYLAAVFFMLAEACELLIATVLIFHVHTTCERIAMVITAWGIPIVIVSITVGVAGLEAYGDDNICWLTNKASHLWAFLGPLIAVIVINAIILAVVTRSISVSRKCRNKSSSERLGSSVKNVLVLTPLFGFTWVFGMFAVNENTVAFQYIFILLNSLQGVFIFICHCFLNKRVRGHIRAWFHTDKPRTKRVMVKLRPNLVGPDVPIANSTNASKHPFTDTSLSVVDV